MATQLNLKVKEVIRETADAITIQFKKPVFKRIKYIPGQYLTLIVKVDGQELHRAYSLCSTPKIDDYLAVTVKRVAGGKVSNFLNDKLKKGDSLKVLAPEGRFQLEVDKSKQRHLVLFGGGSGITPIMSMMQAALAYEPQTKVSLVYANQNEESIIFKDKLDQLLRENTDRLTVAHVLETPSSSWGGYKGRINEESLAEILNLFPSSPKENTEYYMCGPKGYMDMIKSTLALREVDSSKIFSESFTPAAESTASSQQGSSKKGRTIKVIADGEEHIVKVGSNKKILDAVLDAGIDAPFSCQGGFCTACMSKCTSGKVDMGGNDVLTEEELSKGYILTCVSKPLTDDVVIEVEV